MTLRDGDDPAARASEETMPRRDVVREREKEGEGDVRSVREKKMLE